MQEENILNTFPAHFIPQCNVLHLLYLFLKPTPAVLAARQLIKRPDMQNAEMQKHTNVRTMFV